MSRPTRAATHPPVGLTRALLFCGVLAGPVFTLVYLILGASRADYDPLRHPVSSLAIGLAGWTQAASFFVTGALTLAFAWGLWRALHRPGGSTWAAILVAIVGLGLIGAGLFVTDPMNGYPPGTILLSMDYTFPGRMHRTLSALVFIGLPAAAFVLARYFTREALRGWALGSTISGFAFIALFVTTSVGFSQIGGLQAIAGLLQRLTLMVGFGWMAAVAVILWKTHGVLTATPTSATRSPVGRGSN